MLAQLLAAWGAQVAAAADAAALRPPLAFGASAVPMAMVSD
jgi:hypothetical protein